MMEYPNTEFGNQLLEISSKYSSIGKEILSLNDHYWLTHTGSIQMSSLIKLFTSTSFVDFEILCMHCFSRTMNDCKRREHWINTHSSTTYGTVRFCDVNLHRVIEVCVCTVHSVESPRPTQHFHSTNNNNFITTN